MALVTTFFLKKYQKDSHIFAYKTAALNEMTFKLKLENKSPFGRNNNASAHLWRANTLIHNCKTIKQVLVDHLELKYNHVNEHRFNTKPYVAKIVYCQKTVKRCKVYTTGTLERFV